MESVDILGVKISRIDYDSAIRVIERFLRSGKKHYVVTPNPEFIVLAQKDHEFREILNRADLAIPDGVGLRVGTRVTGTDLMLKLCQIAAEKGYSVFLLGGRNGVAEEAAKRLKERFANLNIVGTSEGDPLSNFQFPIYFALRNTLRAGNFQSAIDFLFVAYGAPKQEKWIAKNLPQIPVKVAMGVGGAFDFIAGRRKRAPKILRRLGLEWLWRLLQEPQRLPRILNATIRFPLLILAKRWRRC
jgi:N-acetylglucosaminyldiphosphoundecaprenol N-acetyl-beta-D-mannosaminyltransferase